MQQLPFYVGLLLILCTAYSIMMFWLAGRRSTIILTVMALWLLFQGIIAYNGFYTVTDTMPPRFGLAILPPLATIIAMFATKRGRTFLDGLDTKALTLLHIVRVPVEIVLFWLFVYKAVPEIMTFEGTNFDILSGITAPAAWYLLKRKANSTIPIGWNLVCLALLVNVVATAILAAPTPFQQHAFDQPAIGVLYFPFVWLPAIIVPLVLLSHLVSLRQLVQSRRSLRAEMV